MRYLVIVGDDQILFPDGIEVGDLPYYETLAAARESIESHMDTEGLNPEDYHIFKELD
jgi:hypothetical protein